MSSEEEEGNKDPYGAIKFGEFRKYMQNKQSKLKRQQHELRQAASQERVQLFQGCSIYINGYTDAPTSNLRRMILEHGGDYQHYLKKISVTHIIATNLTNSKIQEFRSYKVVKPEWITESVEKKKLQPWQNYRLVPRASKQKELVFNKVADVSTTSATTTDTPTTSAATTVVPNTNSTTTVVPSESTKTLAEQNPSLLRNEWQRSVSTANPEFIKRFYETSRLHHLSTWKSELKDIVEKLHEKYPKSDSVGKKRKRDELRVVMHVDFDCFFASVGIKDRPHLRGRPVAVSHSKGASEASNSDIASCNYVARSYGLRNGMWIGTAKGLCPDLQVIPYEFEKYKAVSAIFYEIVFQYADEIKPVSVDEAFLEVGSHITVPNSGQEEALATKIRDEIRAATGCEASIGIGANILLARMSTKKAKPAGQYYCKTKQDIETMMSNASVIDLPGVGYAIQEKLKEMKITTVEDVRKLPLHELQTKLGAKMGQTLFQYSRGQDDRPLITNQQRQSVSADVNWGMRFESEENEKEFVEGLSKEVSERLIKLGLKGKTITVKILRRKLDAGEARKHLGHGVVDSISKSYTLSNYTDDPEIINRQAYSMLKSFQFSHLDMRGFGIQITRLNNNQETTSSDQGTLNFKPHHSSGQGERSKSVVVGESSTSAAPRQKEEMTVNYKVFNELPVSVQEELKSNYYLNFEDKDKEAEEEEQVAVKEGILDEPSLPELPPWSQLDPESLLALPDTMRAKVLEAYKNNDKRKPTTPTPLRTPPRSPHRSIPTNKRVSPGNRNRTITELFSPKTNRLQEGLEYDVDVWNELPLEMRNELLAEHRNKQKKIIQEEAQQQQRKAPVVNDEELRHINTQLAAKEPTLQGLSDINEIRTLLKNWVSHFKDKPESEDVNTFCNYLYDLVKISDLEKVRLLIIYLDHITLKEKMSWREYITVIKENVSNTMISIYGYPLQF